MCSICRHYGPVSKLDDAGRKLLLQEIGALGVTSSHIDRLISRIVDIPDLVDRDLAAEHLYEESRRCPQTSGVK